MKITKVPWPIAMGESLSGAFLSVYRWGIEMMTLLVIWLLKCGPIPQHVGFIMDGNRRYAKHLGLEKSSSGHAHGYQNLERVSSVFLIALRF